MLARSIVPAAAAARTAAATAALRRGAAAPLQARRTTALPLLAAGAMQAQHDRGFAGLPNQDGPEWKLGQLNHVAIAVPNIDEAATFYRTFLRAKVSEKVPLPDHGVYTVFVDLGNTKIELLHPLGDKSPIANFLKKNPSGGIHHVCIEVDDIKAAMKELVSHKLRALDPEPKIGAHGKPVVFFHPKDFHGVLVELEQR